MITRGDPAGEALEGFDAIYAIDLVYERDCWKLCGDAHCCNYTRYKRRMMLLGRTHSQELPLLPGEYAYLERRGWTAQFGDHDHKVVDYPLRNGVIRLETLVSRKPSCACDHDTRTTVCRLYPHLPVFDLEGRLLGVDRFGIYEDIEDIDGTDPACKIAGIPSGELQKLLRIAAEIGRDPKALFYAMAYRTAKDHARRRLAGAKAGRSASALQVFEIGMLRRRLFDHDELKARLGELADRFADRYGARFSLP